MCRIQFNNFGTAFGTAKYDRVIKAREVFRFLPQINNSVTIGSNSLLLSISAINILHFLFGLQSSMLQ